LLGGCKVAAEDIEHWKGTVKGPGKIVSVMLADKYAMELRTQAALALVDMERTDRDGTAELQQALERLDETSRLELIRGMVPGLEALMKEGSKPDGGPTPRQIRAKDAAFLLIPYAPPEVKTKLTVDIVNWYVEDFNGRSLAGNYSAEQVIRALGSPAAKVLVTGLKARLPQQALVKMAQLIGQIAEPATRQEAGARLVAIEQEMEGADFRAWIAGTVRDQLQKAGKKADQATIDRAADMNRDNFINEGAIPAMKWLADEPVVKQRLLTLASSPLPGEAGIARRVHALQALEGKVDRSDLQKVLALALDKNNPTSVRDYAFDRVGDIKSPEALPALWPLVTGSDARLRWRAGEMVLAIGGPSVVSEFFSRLPAGDTKYAAEELEGYATRIGQMSPVPVAQMQTLLESPNWYTRVTAIRFFERKGSSNDVKRLEALKTDGAKVEGPHWGKSKTVGDVAEEAAVAAKERLMISGAQ
jgi:HEAT repeat protein